MRGLWFRFVGFPKVDPSGEREKGTSFRRGTDRLEGKGRRGRWFRPLEAQAREVRRNERRGHFMFGNGGERPTEQTAACEVYPTCLMEVEQMEVEMRRRRTDLGGKLCFPHSLSLFFSFQTPFFVHFLRRNCERRGFGRKRKRLREGTSRLIGRSGRPIDWKLLKKILPKTL